MAFFPLFLDLEGKQVLLLGSGPHAQEKKEKLRLFDCQLLHLPTQAFTPALLTPDTAMVILADRHHPENSSIAARSRALGIPVNAVDDPPLCDFHFPALVRRGSMTIAISTEGAAPAVGRLIREELEAQLPDRTEELLLWSAELTAQLRAAGLSYQERSTLLNRALRSAFALGRPLTGEELGALDLQFTFP